MKLSLVAHCPRCPGDLTPGPVSTIARRVSRAAVVCPVCGWAGVLTATLVERRERSMDHASVA